MINNLLENPFSNSRMGNDDFGLMAFGHIQFLKAQNKSKAFDKMIAKVEPPYTSFQEFLNSQNKANTEKEGKTISVKSVLKNFNNFIDDLNDEIISWKRKKPEVFNSFFPSGKKEYKSANITEIETLMKRLSWQKKWFFIMDLEIMLFIPEIVKNIKKLLMTRLLF